jgi:hypothetical protein
LNFKIILIQKFQNLDLKKLNSDSNFQNLCRLILKYHRFKDLDLNLNM